MSKTKKPKVQRVAKDDPLWALLADAIASDHPHLKDVRFSLLWGLNWQPREDEEEEFVKVKILGDEGRLEAPYHVRLVVNASAWKHVADNVRAPLLDEQLERLKAKGDVTPGVVPVLKLRKPTARLYAAVMRRWGLSYRDDLDELVEARREAEKTPLFSYREDGVSVDREGATVVLAGVGGEDGPRSEAG